MLIHESRKTLERVSVSESIQDFQETTQWLGFGLRTQRGCGGWTVQEG